MSEVFKTIVITAVNTEIARATAVALSPGGVGMFFVPLAPKMPTPDPELTRAQVIALRRNYNPEITHYISTGFINSDFAALLGNVSLMHSYAITGAAQRGLTYTVSLAELQAALASADISVDNPGVVMTRLGLQLV